MNTTQRGYEQGSLLAGIIQGVWLTICVVLIISGAMMNSLLTLIVGFLGLLCMMFVLAATLSQTSHYRNSPTLSSEDTVLENEIE